MNFCTHTVAQCLVHALMALHAALAGKFLAHHHRLEMLAVTNHTEVVGSHALLDIFLNAFCRDHNSPSRTSRNLKVGWVERLLRYPSLLRAIDGYRYSPPILQTFWGNHQCLNL